jgi:hypothetical protein
VHDTVSEAPSILKAIPSNVHGSRHHGTTEGTNLVPVLLDTVGGDFVPF